MNKYLFTVFTPTYNRAATLPDVYDSLRQQTLKSFEWLVIDDGSSDNTHELVATWIEQGEIPIRYYYQENAGKHAAFNEGVRRARGELFVPLDSDDALTVNGLEILHRRWEEIPSEIRSGFSGISCQCLDERGAIVGTQLPADFVDGHPFEVISRLRLTGERFGFHRTEILRDFPFPVFTAERFVPEGLVWNRIGALYKMRFVSDAVRIYRDSLDGLTASSVRIRRQSPLGTTMYYIEALVLSTSIKMRLSYAINVWRFALFKPSFIRVLPLLPRFPVTLSIGLIPGLILLLFDLFRSRHL